MLIFYLAFVPITGMKEKTKIMETPEIAEEQKLLEAQYSGSPEENVCTKTYQHYLVS